jgi:hypothetical protein
MRLSIVDIVEVQLHYYRMNTELIGKVGRHQNTIGKMIGGEVAEKTLARPEGTSSAGSRSAMLIKRSTMAVSGRWWSTWRNAGAEGDRCRLTSGSCAGTVRVQRGTSEGAELQALVAGGSGLPGKCAMGGDRSQGKRSQQPRMVPAAV